MIGRFISADTIVQNPADPQTLNRYSYCVNNPLIYTDPDGQFAWIPILIWVAWTATTATASYTASTVAMNVVTGQGTFDNLSWSGLATDIGTDLVTGGLGKYTKIGKFFGKLAGKADNAMGFAGKADEVVGVGYHATDPVTARKIMQGGEFRMSKRGRLGPGQYVADTPEGAIAEFRYHRGMDAPVSIVEVKYNVGRNLDVRPLQKGGYKPSIRQGNRLATESSADTITYQSIRQRGGTNTVIRNKSGMPVRILR